MLCINDLLNNDLSKTFFYFHIFSILLVFKHDFIRCVDVIHIAASNTVTDGVTN